jgi:hypothetical protein
MTMSRCAISRAEHGTTRIPGGTGIGGCEKSSTKKRENIRILTTIQVAAHIQHSSWRCRVRSKSEGTFIVVCSTSRRPRLHVHSNPNAEIIF